MQHLQHIGAGHAGPKKAFAINLSNVSDLVPNRGNLADGGLKPLLYIGGTAQMMTRILPHVPCEKQRWELPEI